MLDCQAFINKRIRIAFYERTERESEVNKPQQAAAHKQKELKQLTKEKYNNFQKQTQAQNTKSKSLPVSDARPILGGPERILKPSEVSSCRPTGVTMHEQLFELESVLSESGHVCPSDCMSRMREGFQTLFLLTFQCWTFREFPPCNKSHSGDNGEQDMEEITELLLPTRGILT